MLVVYAKIEPTTGLAAPLFCVTKTSQWESDGAKWWQEGLAQQDHHDVLIVYFPECKHQRAVDFMHSIHEQPSLMDTVAALESDGILWKMWSVEMAAPTPAWDKAYNEAYPGNNFGINPCAVDSTPNDTDHKFLKSLKIKWEPNENEARSKEA